MVSNSVVHKESLGQGYFKFIFFFEKKTSADCKRLLEVNLIHCPKHFFKKCVNILDDKIILSHFDVSLSHFSLCIQKKTIQLNLFEFIFLSQHDFSQNFSLLQQKKACLNFVVIKLPNKTNCKFLSPNFFVKVYFKKLSC